MAFHALLVITSDIVIEEGLELGDSRPCRKVEPGLRGAPKVLYDVVPRGRHMPGEVGPLRRSSQPSGHLELHGPRSLELGRHHAVEALESHTRPLDLLLDPSESQMGLRTRGSERSSPE